MTELQALLDVIEHWKRLATGTSEGREWVGRSDCALCKKYMSIDFTCGECPIPKVVGLTNCLGTPHADLEDYLDRVKDKEGAILDRIEIKQRKKFQKYAAKEVEFLEKLTNGLYPYE